MLLSGRAKRKRVGGVWCFELRWMETFYSVRNCCFTSPSVRKCSRWDGKGIRQRMLHKKREWIPKLEYNSLSSMHTWWWSKEIELENMVRKKLRARPRRWKLFNEIKAFHISAWAAFEGLEIFLGFSTPSLIRVINDPNSFSWLSDCSTFMKYFLKRLGSDKINFELDLARTTNFLPQTLSGKLDINFPCLFL